MLLSKCAICGTIKLRFMKQQEAKRLKSLGLKTPLNKILLLNDSLFWMLSNHYKMNEIVNKWLLARDKWPGFTYSVFGPVTKNKEIIQKFKETGDTKCIYKNE